MLRERLTGNLQTGATEDTAAALPTVSRSPNAPRRIKEHWGKHIFLPSRFVQTLNILADLCLQMASHTSELGGVTSGPYHPFTPTMVVSVLPPRGRHKDVRPKIRLGGKYHGTSAMEGNYTDPSAIKGTCCPRYALQYFRTLFRRGGTAILLQRFPAPSALIWRGGSEHTATQM